MNSSKLVIIAACVAFAALVYVSIVPHTLRPHTSLPGPVEHVIGYGGLMLVVAWALPRRGARLAAAMLLVLVAGVLELSQLLVAGRDSQFIDFLASSLGIGLGLVAHFLSRRVMGRAVD